MSDSGEADATEETVQLCQNSSSVNDDEANNNAMKTFEANLVIKGKRSVVWEYFTFKGSKQKGPNKKRVFCKICEKTVKKGKMMVWDLVHWWDDKYDQSSEGLAQIGIQENFGGGE